jgi:hypothetical protein
MKRFIAAVGMMVATASLAGAFGWGGGGGGSSTPVATTSVAGKVKPDGSTITVQTDGTISAPSGGGGNVTGPGSSTTGHVATYANSAGTLLLDGGALTPAAIGALPATSQAVDSAKLATVTPSTNFLTMAAHTFSQMVTDLNTALRSAFDSVYQAILVSGTNIKTVNGSSLLGSGDLTVAGGLSDAPNDGNFYGRQSAGWLRGLSYTNWTSNNKVPYTTTNPISAGATGTFPTGSQVRTFANISCAANQAVQRNGDVQRCVALAGASMVYPGAGVPVSTGSAWGTSLNITAVSDSTSTTSSTTAGSATAVKAAYDLANGKAPATSGSVPLKGNGSGGFSAATYSDFIALFGSGSCSGLPKSDGTCVAAPQTISCDATTGKLISYTPSTGAFVCGTDQTIGGGALSNVLTSAHIFVGNAINVATDVAVSGDGTLSNTGVLTITKINGTSLGGLATGLLKNTISTGVPSIAVAADIPDLSATYSAVTAIRAPAYGGTGIANGSNNTITFTGNYTLGVTLSGNTSLTLPTSGTLATLAGAETFSGKTLTSPTENFSVLSSTSQGTASVNIDGTSGIASYSYNNGASNATYTFVVTAAPASTYVRYVNLHIGGDAGVITKTYTNVKWLGTAGSATTVTNKFDHYCCEIRSDSKAYCAIIAEGSTN